MDENSLRWLAAHAILTRHGRVQYIKKTAEMLHTLCFAEEVNPAQAANQVIEAFELELCSMFDKMAGDLLNISWEENPFRNQATFRVAIAWCNAELAKPDREWKVDEDDY